MIFHTFTKFIIITISITILISITSTSSFSTILRLFVIHICCYCSCYCCFLREGVLEVWDLHRSKPAEARRDPPSGRSVRCH